MSDYVIEMKVKGRLGEHWAVIDEYKAITPDTALVILQKKYVNEKKDLSKLMKAFDDTWKAASVDVEKFLGIHDEEISEDRE